MSLMQVLSTQSENIGTPLENGSGFGQSGFTFGVVSNNSRRASCCWFLRATSARARHFRGSNSGRTDDYYKILTRK